MEWHRGSETAGHSWLQRSAYTNSLACLAAVSLSFCPNVSFVPLLLFARIIALFQSNKLPTHMVLCVTVELPSCVGLSGVELKPDIKHTTKQRSHENKMKLLWGSNREPSLQTHTQAFKWKHVLKAWLLKPLPCHSFIKNGADCAWKNLEGADWVTDKQKLPQHPAPFSPSASPVFKVTRWLFSTLFSSVTLFSLPHTCPNMDPVPQPPALLNPHLQQTY